jgi:mutator protein MutT
LSAVFPIIIRNKEEKRQILLHVRKNTGYMDGKWDVAGSGHVDEGETATHAVIRECAEELGITVSEEDIEFGHLSHNVDLSGEHTYYNIYFFIHKYEGNARIMEPEKSENLQWFDVDNLPNNMIDVRQKDIIHCIKKELYSEHIHM